MKKTTLLNSNISAVVSRMGHMDTIAIGDAGLPIPEGPERIDLAVCKGLPEFLPVLEAVLSELCVQKAVIASEMNEKNTALYANLIAKFKDMGVQVVEVPHTVFKELTRASKAVVRTGECLPYANIILESGVVF